MKKIYTCLSVILFTGWLVSCSGPLVSDIYTTYCNPTNIDYGFGFGPARHASDPTIVYFKDRYYLFTSWDFDGYRVSDDLTHWSRISFAPENRADAMLVSPTKYTAPAAATDGKYIYYFDYNTSARPQTPILRTANPESGKWEVCGMIDGKPQDPCLYIENGRFFVYHGLGSNRPTTVFELNPETMTKIPGSDKVLRDTIKDVNLCEAGYHLTRRELYEEIDAEPWVGKFAMLPCPEGAWMTRYGNKYYLQYSTPGTLSQWYCDIIMEGNSPEGPFTELPYNPVAMKVGGFMGSSGHSCVFKDRYGNLWRTSTMWIGTLNGFERRMGMFPVSFDEKGRMITHTVAGDWPMPLPQKQFTPEEIHTAGWYPLSYHRSCAASSTEEGHAPELASDENCRTHWSALTGDPGEWFLMDLGEKMTVHALQINFADYKFNPKAAPESDYHAYILYYSNDGENWKILVDKKENRTAVPHDYIELKRPLKTRYLKVENVHTPREGKFALLDLRAFGRSNAPRPAAPDQVSVSRVKEDSRCARISWNAVPNADGYFVRFGYQPDFLNQCIQVRADMPTRLTLHTLIKGQTYYYRVDSYNAAGITEGTLMNEN